jgi:hypothetical protein
LPRPAAWQGFYQDAESMKVLSMVRFRPGVAHDEAWAAWAEHTRIWDSRDHPQILRTELTRFAAVDAAAAAFDGMALTEWSSEAAFREAAAWYATPESAAHSADLARFLDFDGMVTVIVQDTAAIVPAQPARVDESG